MRLTLDSLYVLDAIARKGSFAAASEELHRVPSAITYTVQKLEQDLDIALFDRSGHRAKLTSAGEKLLQDGRHLLRAAAELEHSVKRVATGWEVELAIAVDDLIPLTRIYPLVAAFYAENHGTRLRIITEVFGGTWDALAAGRADLAIGVSGEGPAGGGYATRALGEMAFVFVVTPDHPLAGSSAPLTSDEILRYRAIAAADSSRNIPPRTSYLLSGQDVLTVPDMRAKLEAHRMGLGVGFVPRTMIKDDLAAGRLIIKEVACPVPEPRLFIAWRNAREGNALIWFLDRMEDPALLARFLGEEWI
ncbi:MAG: LysR family transcriptional regulator [Gammaproteobacteria bacterium]|nr:LysR family transcriptional regulator [Gammaproteobacteria bacterium]